MTRSLAVVVALTSACFGSGSSRIAFDTTQAGDSSESGDATVPTTVHATTTEPTSTSSSFCTENATASISTGTDTSLPTTSSDVTDVTSTTIATSTGDVSNGSTDASGTTGDVCEQWPTCQRGATCDSGECWLAESGWFCSPQCAQDVDCDQCGLPGECLGGWCRRPCVTNKECAVGQLCDGATGTCVWSSPCGPSDDAGSTWGPCDMANGCMAAGDVCIHDGPFSICLPACPCRVDAGEVCGLSLGETACGRSGLCELPCTGDSECTPGMVCAAHGVCLWA